MSQKAMSEAELAVELERLRRRVRELETADEEEGRSRDELEIRIEERVSELKAANETVRAQVAERESRQAELQKLNRTLKAHSRSARAMMRATNETDYLQEVCRIVVEDCGHAMVWIGFAEDDAAKSVRPVAYSGFEKGYLETLKLTWADTERGRGPTGTAIRTGKPCSCRNMLDGSRLRSLARRGAETGLCLVARPPADGRRKGLRRDHDLRAGCPTRSPRMRADLLSDLADDLAFGITSLRMREAHARMEDELRSLALFPDENPGPVMRVSKDGTILYGNKAAGPILASWASRVGGRRARAAASDRPASSGLRRGQGGRDRMRRSSVFPGLRADRRPRLRHALRP